MANEIAGFGSFEISACNCSFWNMSWLGIQVFFLIIFKILDFRHEIDIGGQIFIRCIMLVIRKKNNQFWAMSS
jgi:hypothetical protein